MYRKNDKSGIMPRNPKRRNIMAIAKTKTPPTAETPVHHDTLVEAVREAMKRHCRGGFDATHVILKSPDGKFVLSGKPMRRYKEVCDFYCHDKRPFGKTWTPQSEDEIRICAEGFTVMKEELELMDKSAMLQRTLKRLRETKDAPPKK